MEGGIEKELKICNLSSDMAMAKIQLRYTSSKLVNDLKPPVKSYQVNTHFQLQKQKQKLICLFLRFPFVHPIS